MLRSFRQNIKGTMGKILLAIIIVPFIGFGALDFLSGGGEGESVANVNGQEIGQREFLETLSMRRNQLAAQMGEDADFSQLADERLAPGVRQHLIQSALTEQFSSRMQMVVSSKVVDQALVGEESFKENGQFSNERMQFVLSQSGMTLNGLKALIAREIRQNQLAAGLGGSAITSDAEIDLLLDMTQETRTINSARVKFASVFEKIDIEPDALSKFYESRRDDFVTSLAVDVDYILLDANAFRPEVEEQAILDEYEFRKDQYEVVETRSVAHIMLEVNGERTEAAAIEQLARIKARLAEGAQFAELAKEFSEDSGSADVGGDLGKVERDGTFPAEFEDALFSLTEGEVSEPVISDAGVHLIKAVSIEQSEMASLDELREEIRDQIQLAEATRRYVQLKEELADLVFNADGLNDPAQTLKLNVQTFQKMSQAGVNVDSGELAPSFLQNASIVEALFSDELMEEGLNSELVELDSMRSVVVAVSAVYPPRQKSLDEVKAAVADLYRREQVAETLAALAEEASEVSSRGMTLEAFAANKGYELDKGKLVSRQSQDFDPAVLTSIFAASRSSLGKAIHSVVSANGDLVIYELQSIDIASDEASSQLRELMSQQVARLVAQQELAAVFSGLEQRAEIVINE